MSVDASFLSSFLGDPARSPGVVGWDYCKSKLGVALPSDYQILSDLYPRLIVGGFVRMLHPASVKDHGSLLIQAPPMLDALRMLKSDDEEFPYGIHPDVPGLFPWGSTLNGDYCLWLTNGTPEEWTIIVSDLADWWEFDGGLVDFLKGFMSGEISCPLFPDDVPISGEVLQELK